MPITSELEISIDGEQVAAAMARAMRQAANKLDPKPVVDPVDVTSLRAAGLLLMRLSRMGASVLGPESKLKPGDLHEIAEACHRVADGLDP